MKDAEALLQREQELSKRYDDAKTYYDNAIGEANRQSGYKIQWDWDDRVAYTMFVGSVMLQEAGYTNVSYNLDDTNIGKSIDQQRISISGVDTDDEAVNLLKYQNAYTMASKMIQTLTEVYDRLILQTGV